jgi:hypothetical protein
MADPSGVQFGRVLEKDKGDKKVWLLVLLVLVGVTALVVVAIASRGKVSGLEREVQASTGRLEELQKSVDERDKLLVQARADEAVMKTAGQAAAMFYSVAPDATESGIAFAHPEQKAVKVYLYGLTQPPDGQEYAVFARAGDGTQKPLGPVLPDQQGNGFLLAKEIPEGTAAIQLVFRPTGDEGTEEATPRIAARYPSGPDERGVLTDAPRRARRAR